VVSAAPSRPEEPHRLAKASGRPDGWGEATGVSEVRSREAPWEENTHARHGRRDIADTDRGPRRREASFSDPPKRLGCRETLGSLVKPRGAQTPRGAHAVKAAERTPGSARGAGARSFVEGWQKSIGRIRCLARREVKSLVAEAKASRALAGRKLEAPSDAGHEWREGESVRGTSAIYQTSAHVSASGFRLACSGDDGRRLRAFARFALTGRSKRGS